MKNILSIFAVIIFLSAILACSGGNDSKPTETTTKSPENKTETNSSSNKSDSNKSDSNKSESNTSETKTSTSSNADLAGTYTVNGSSLDGKSYAGQLEIIKQGQVFQLKWNLGNDSYDGIGVQDGNTLAAAYTTGEDGKGCGAVIYKISGNSLTGKWGEWGVDEAGSENAVARGELKGDTGVFDITGKNPNGSEYKGSLTITKSGNDVYQFSWDAGKKYVGTGVKMGDYLAAGSGTKQCGFVIYEIKGGTLEGKWGVPGTTQLGSEKAGKK